jgi:Family of unknown function (DUF5955)
MSRDRRGRSIRVGNIENSTGIAIGDGARVEVNQSPTPNRGEVSALLDEFINLLDRYREALDDAEGVRQSAIEVRAEIARPSPKWQAVRRALASIATAVGGVAALTDAMNNIQALLAHIID